jgi:hypothetical protein
LPKPLSDGFLGVGYTAVAFSNRQRLFTFLQLILETVALHMQRQRFLHKFKATVFHMQRDIAVAITSRGNGFGVATET